MKTALIFTGGTISSALNGGYLSPADKTKNELIKALGGGIAVESFQPYYILSEQLNGAYLTELIKCVGERLSEDFDGIIVTHGTDTLQYSAAALSIAFSDSDIPIILVSSNYILSDTRSNGLSNLKYALKFMKEKIGGVYVSYKNEGENPEIFTADTLLPHSPYSDKLSSLDGAFGYFNGDGFVKLKERALKKGAGVFSLSKNSDILWIRIGAGMSFPDPKGFKAVLLEGYHSGTLPTEDKAFLEFCKKCSSPIYLSGLSDEIRYESTKLYEQLNIVVLEKQSPIYAYISLWKNL